MALKLGKVDAAVRHIDAAIAAANEGHFDIAITLAGAAEGMLPATPVSLFDRLLGHSRAASVGRKMLISQINGVRDWLKHLTPEKPQEIQVTEPEALFLIARAMSHVPGERWSDRMISYRPRLIEKLKAI